MKGNVCCFKRFQKLANRWKNKYDRSKSLFSNFQLARLCDRWWDMMLNPIDRHFDLIFSTFGGKMLYSQKRKTNCEMKQYVKNTLKILKFTQLLICFITLDLHLHFFKAQKPDMYSRTSQHTTSRLTCDSTTGF